MGDFIRIPEASKMMNLSGGFIREHIKRKVPPFDKNRGANSERENRSCQRYLLHC